MFFVMNPKSWDEISKFVSNQILGTNGLHQSFEKYYLFMEVKSPRQLGVTR